MIGVVAIGLLIAAGIRWAGEEEASVEGPAPLPMDETVSQVLPGPDGEPEVWTLRKREATAAEQAESGLPAPSPRESAEDRRTESARTLNAQALEAWKHGELRTALERFEAAVEQDPDDWLPRSDYGRLLVMMTDYGKAATHLERSAELNPGDPRVWLDLHSYYQRTLQLELALDARERAIELAGGRAIVQDRSGLWRLEDDSIFP
jgi:Flp pilus assembly protein TadD